MQPRERRAARGPCRPTARSVFGARDKRWMHEFTPRRTHTAPDLLDRLHLLRREAGAGVLACLARQYRRIELALARIVDDAVDDAVDCVAGRRRRLAEDRRLACRDVALGIFQRGHRIPEVRAGI